MWGRVLRHTNREKLICLLPKGLGFHFLSNLTPFIKAVHVASIHDTTGEIKCTWRLAIPKGRVNYSPRDKFGAAQLPFDLGRDTYFLILYVWNKIHMPSFIIICRAPSLLFSPVQRTGIYLIGVRPGSLHKPPIAHLQSDVECERKKNAIPLAVFLIQEGTQVYSSETRCEHAS